MYPVRHKLKECTMMKNYMTTRTFAKGKKPEDDSAGKAAAPIPEEKAIKPIYGGPTPTSPSIRSNYPTRKSML
jgi:hypothetical protein